MSSTVWIIAAATVTALIGLLAVMRRPNPSPDYGGLPTEWPLTQRAIFSAEERILFRHLRQALPHHIILAKLPLVRFCQPADRKDLRQWFDLLSPIHVSFVICADNGLVLAALDVERPDRPTSRRVAMIKQAVLLNCRVRYVKCNTDQLPTVAELQLLLPGQGEAARPVVPSKLQPDSRSPAGHSTLAHSMRGRRQAQRPWSDSRYTNDSFFAPDGERDPVLQTEDNEAMTVGLQAAANQHYLHHDNENNIPSAETADRWAHDTVPRAAKPASTQRRATPMPPRDQERFRASRR